VWLLLCVSVAWGQVFPAGCKLESDRVRPCNDCVAMAGCGWCAGRKECLNGTATGPTQENGRCFVGWLWGQGTEPLCPNCVNRTSCAACRSNVNCMWCLNGGRCMDLAEDVPTCITKNDDKNCTCDMHRHCTTCTNDQSSCWWCQEKQRCFSTDFTNIQGCTFTAQPQCPTCENIPDCQSCLQTDGCGFCGAKCMQATMCPGGKGYDDCDANCRQLTDCEPCMFSKGCQWCLENGRCEGLDMIKLQPCQNFAIVCPRPSSFDAGSFIGGMALVVGLAAACFGGYFIFRYYTRRSAYTTV